MSGHRWSSISSLGILLALSGCQSAEWGRAAWNPFRKPTDKASVAEEESALPLSKFAHRDTEKKSSTQVTTALPIAEEQVDRLLAQGQQALQENRIEDARQAYTEVLNSSPDNATAHHGMAMASDLSQQWADAEYHYRQALRIRPRDANLLCDIGYSYLLQNRYSEASRYLNHAIEINPKHESAQMNLALLDLRQGNRAAAEDRIASRFGSSGQAAQILSQLESQTSETVAQKAESTPAIPENASIEQIQEMARQERLEAERRRAMQRIPQPPQLHDVSFDAQSGMPVNHHYGDPNFAADPNRIAASWPNQGMPQTPQPWANSPAANNFQSSGTHPPQIEMGNPNSYDYLNKPVHIMPESYKAPGSSASQVNQTEPVYPSSNQAAMNSYPTAPGKNAETTTNVASGPAAPGFNPMMSNAPASNVTAPLPTGAGTNAGRIVPVYSSGAFQAPPAGSVSYGQPMGFIPPPRAESQQFNTVSASNSVPISANGMMGTGNNGMGQNAPPAYVQGLNAGPGAIFPIGATVPAGQQSLNGNPSALNSEGSNPTETNGYGVTGSAVSMGNISSPGTNSVVNGYYYGQPQSSLPSQEWANQQQQQLRAQQLQSRQWQVPAGAQPNGEYTPTTNTNWPATRQQPNPLEAYELQRQQLDSQYNRSLQQLDRQNVRNALQFP